MIKKFLGIIFLVLLWCNVGFTQELIKIPIIVHIVEIDRGEFNTITSKETVEEDVYVANEIWSQANIFWSLKQVNFIKPNLKGFEKNYKWSKKRKGSKGERLRKIYLKFLNKDLNQSMEGINIYYLPKMLTIACGVAIYKIKNNNLIYKNAQILLVIGNACLGDEDLSGKTLAHELGHILNLKHNKNINNLMYFDMRGGVEIVEEKTINMKQVSVSLNNAKKIKRMF